MTTQPLQGPELIPRPQHTPAALRAALAVVAPDRLLEMTRDQTEAMTAAVERGSVKPLLIFVRKWAAEVEIARFPDALGALRRAEYLAAHAPTQQERREQASAAGAILRAAAQAAQG
jgi:hypothetical protein